MKKRIVIFCILILGNLFCLHAQDLVYKPINPAFGGDTFNYQWLLSSAQAQNKLEESSGKFTNDPLKDFKNNLNRQILNELSRKLTSQIFGEEAFQDGLYQYGAFQVSIQTGLDGITISIINTDGSRTEVKVPYY
jgi:curli production assembly/transport component CsgF